MTALAKIFLPKEILLKHYLFITMQIFQQTVVYENFPQRHNLPSTVLHLFLTAFSFKLFSYAKKSRADFSQLSSSNTIKIVNAVSPISPSKGKIRPRFIQRKAINYRNKCKMQLKIVKKCHKHNFKV